MAIAYEIRPIRVEEWLPDRCMAVDEPLAVRDASPRYGCPNLLFGESRIRNRTDFEEFYRDVLRRFSCCGFVAWKEGRVVGYVNFFPHEVARDMRFFGWGETDTDQPGTLIHHCISLVRSAEYRRKGISSGLLRHALEWAKAHDWKRYEVHDVLPDSDAGAASEQKSVLSFWRKFGFSIIGEEEADAETRKRYGADKRYSLALNTGDF